jgi:triphosphoribosyl-dephospho-CoA synthase
MNSLGFHANLACIWEATARKPGNVHRFCDFEDASYLDFLQSAAAIAPVFDRAADLSVGHLILDAVAATRRAVSTNTNLGIVLLLAPLAKACAYPSLQSGIHTVLEGLTVHDAELAYEAIRLSAPSGMGKVDQQDIAAKPTQTLREVMALAADRDRIAAQYVHGFSLIFDDGVPALERALEQTGRLEAAIIACHLHLLSRYPDTLIARKCGAAMAEELRRRATDTLAGGPDAIEPFDRWLRSDGHRLNPGTTADLVTACLFALLAGGKMALPPRWPW